MRFDNTLYTQKYRKIPVDPNNIICLYEKTYFGMLTTVRVILLKLKPDSFNTLIILLHTATLMKKK